MGMSLRQIKRGFIQQARRQSFAAEIRLWSDQLMPKRQSACQIADFSAAVDGLAELSRQGLSIKSIERLSGRLRKQVLELFALSGFKSKVDLQQQGFSPSDLVVIVPPKKKIQFSFKNLLSLSGGNLFFIVGSDSQLAVVEQEAGKGWGSVFVLAGRGARVDYLFFSRQSRHKYYYTVLRHEAVVNFYSSVKPVDYLYLTVVIDQQGGLSQGNIKAVLQAGGTSKSVVNLINYHYGKKTKGDIAIRGVGRAQAWSRINGWIVIDKKALQTDSYLQEDVLLLSDKVSLKAEPNLEILNNEVRASHGATLGSIDENQLYYLRSRGLNKKQAERIIERGFISGLVTQIDNIFIKQYFS